MSEEFNIRTLFNLYWSKKRLIALIVASAMILITAYAFFAPREYEAVATLLPASKSGGGGLSGFIQSISGGGMFPGAFSSDGSGQAVENILESRFVAERIAKKLDIKSRLAMESTPDAVVFSAVRSMISATAERDGLIVVTVSAATDFFPDDEDKKNAKTLARDVANAAIEAMNDYIRESGAKNARRSISYIENALTDYRRRLDSIENDIEVYQREHKILSLKEQTSAIIGNAVAIGAELQKAQIELNLARRDYSSGSTMLEAYENKVKYLREQYEKVQLGGIADDEFSISLDKMPSILRKYSNLQRDREILEQVILFLETQKHQETIEEEKTSSIADVLDRAQTPLKATKPAKMLVFILGFFLSSTLTLLGVAIYAVFKGNYYLFEEKNAANSGEDS